MKLAIMQPYFLPYIGYWQLLNAVDEFIVYDNIKYTKKGWINRNRILNNDKDTYITLSLKKDSDYLDIKDRFLISDDTNNKKELNRISQLYRKAPYYKNIFPIIESIMVNCNLNLFWFIYKSMVDIKNYLEIDTNLIISSTIDIDHSLKSEDKVISLCNSRKADIYINAIGGMELYDKNKFKNKNIDLFFIKSNKITYKQYDNEFVPWLSILDVLMFNSKEHVIEMLSDYTLI
jgi:hypothetical protein